MRKLVPILLVAAIFSIFLTTSTRVKAQDDEPMQPDSPTLPDDYHARITREAIRLLPDNIQLEIFKDSNSWISSKYKIAVVAGSYAEDHPLEDLPWFHHSWNPDSNLYWYQALTLIPNPLLQIIINRSKGTALDWADYYFREAIRLYDPDREDNSEAYFMLGRAAHLLGDMATPAHVNLDGHYPFELDNTGVSPDNYEEYLKGPGGIIYEINDDPWDYRSERAHVAPELESQLAAYNLTGVTTDNADELWAKGPISYSSRHYSVIQRHRIDYDLFHIYHSMAELADNFGSNDSDGEQSTYGRRYNIDELEEIRKTLYQESIIRIAALIQLFWDRTHTSSNVDVILIIDSSGSMGTNDRDNMRLGAAITYLTVSVPGDYVGVVDFDSDARLVAPLQHVHDNKSALKTAIATIDSSGGTNIGAGIQLACDTLSASTSGNSTKAAILLTDGNGSFSDQHTCFADQRWPIYAFGFGSANDDLLRMIASNTGGEFSRLVTSNFICGFQAVRNKIAAGVPGHCLGFHVNPKATIKFPLVVVEFQLQLTVATSWPGSDVEMKLISPSGKVYDRNTVDPDMVHDLGPTFESYTITNPEAGEWEVSLYGADLPEGGEEVIFSHTTIPLPASTPASITIKKEALAAGEQTFAFTGDGGSFNLKAGESKTVVDLSSGDYDIIESLPTGWMLDRVECDGTFSVIENGITVNLNAGENVTCTFYNSQSGRITIKNRAPFDVEESFDFSGDLDPFVLKHKETAAFNQLAAGEYEVTELVPDGWNLDAVECGESNVTAVEDGVKIQLDAGESATCIFYNSKTGRVTIRKRAPEEIDTKFRFSGDLGTFGLRHKETRVFENLVAGEYMVAEVERDGWRTESVECGDANTAAVENGVKIKLLEGENVLCTFLNTTAEFQGSVFMPMVSGK